MGPGDALPSDRGPEMEVVSGKSTPIGSTLEASVPAPVPASEDAFSHSVEMSLMLIVRVSMISAAATKGECLCASPCALVAAYETEWSIAPQRIAKLNSLTSTPLHTLQGWRSGEAEGRKG